MSADSLAEDLAPLTIGGLNAQEAAALGIAITDENVRPRRAARRAPTHETLTGWARIDPELQPEDSDTRSSGPHPRRKGCWSPHLPPWLCALQHSPPRHGWRPA
jgi:hypothetical protein